MTWAQRLKRVSNIDIEICSACGGAMKVIACIEDLVVIQKILEHLKKKDEASESNALPESRAPPARQGVTIRQEQWKYKPDSGPQNGKVARHSQPTTAGLWGKRAFILPIHILLHGRKTSYEVLCNKKITVTIALAT